MNSKNLTTAIGKQIKTRKRFFEKKILNYITQHFQIVLNIHSLIHTTGPSPINPPTAPTPDIREGLLNTIQSSVKHHYNIF